MEFFRHCPNCGRRFHIKLEAKEPITGHRESMPRLVRRGRGISLTLDERDPIVVDFEEFQYEYKCMHCGHEWSEKHVESLRER
jgi:DNA-directed RNA polymerase subunit RPC12/RpoP